MPDRLDDGVTDFLSDQDEMAPFFELENLRVPVAGPEYLLEIK